MKKVHLLFILSTLLSVQSALATQQQPQYQDMPSDIAKSLVTTALKICHSKNKTGVVAVVDKGGNLVALQRDENVGPHNTLAAQKKAYTALSTKSDTRELAKKAASDPETKNLNTVPQLLLLGGGVPVKSGNMVIGAIGVAGTGGPADDQHCAQEAIKEVMGN
ncbi:TPA: heme-binding protein [Escherichia coli]|uniref:GlcG/HbpS family heme-binding protein n=1 Tax=Escherichia TaxID=561 RepID=UPI0007E4476F|nr:MULTISPECIES: heme-binding protein [Escherichia]EFC9846575.1 heme-binding protein [Escherichia coli]EFG2179111.1 heme-binding protein [Escherichia coli]EFK1933104.1 heme-binding protein [Escherichia coli]EFK3243549.1 heme-binding protein [Escherichia coli]EFL5793319.1 heme-binding protein [Escherichia coli]